MTYYLLALYAVTITSTFAALFFWRRARAWALVFGRLSNGERILLMWPQDPAGRSLRTLSFEVDTKQNVVRLAAGSTLIAKFPLDAAIAGQRALQELIDSSKGRW